MLPSPPVRQVLLFRQPFPAGPAQRKSVLPLIMQFNHTSQQELLEHLCDQTCPQSHPPQWPDHSLRPRWSLRRHVRRHPSEKKKGRVGALFKFLTNLLRGRQQRRGKTQKGTRASRKCACVEISQPVEAKSLPNSAPRRQRGADTASPPQRDGRVTIRAVSPGRTRRKSNCLSRTRF